MDKEVLEKALELEHEGIEIYQTLLDGVEDEDSAFRIVAKIE
jgi:rubrerythrin